MQNFQTFSPTNFTQLGTGIVFYILLVISTFFSIGTIYVLVRYGKSKSLGFGISVIYIIFYLSLVGTAISNLNAIK